MATEIKRYVRVMGHVNAPGTRAMVYQEIHPCGLFHSFGLALEEDERGFSNYSVAIVELPTGEVITPCAHHIQFIDPMAALKGQKL